MDEADLVVTVVIARVVTEDAKKARKVVHLANSLLHSAAAWEEVVEVLDNHSFILGPSIRHGWIGRGQISRHNRMRETQRSWHVPLKDRSRHHET